MRSKRCRCPVDLGSAPAKRTSWSLSCSRLAQQTRCPRILVIAMGRERQTELASLADAIEAYEAVRRPNAKEPGCKASWFVSPRAIRI
jgi:hypothetical protein